MKLYALYMKFELTSGNYSDYIRLCNVLLFHPSIRSAIFEDDFKVVVNLDTHRLAEFAMLIRNLELEVVEARKTGSHRSR